MRERKLGLEWLRIISMLMIILLHSIDHSGLYENLNECSALYYYEQFIYAAVQVCVNCFVMISGYFLVTSSFKFSKLLSLWAEVVFYSLAIKLLLMGIGEIPVSVTSLAACFAPFITGRYWFITIYVGMYCLSPFFNIAIKAMTQKQHKILNIILFFLFSVLVSVHPSLKGMNTNGGWSVAGFAVLYFWAAYLRLYYTPQVKKWKRPLVIYLLCPAIMTVVLAISEKTGIGVLTDAAKNLWKYDSVLAYIATVALFMLFLNIGGKGSGKGAKLLTRISGATFGVYLIHAHANICTVPMWDKIKFVPAMEQAWFPLYQIAAVLVIFIVCAVIDILRQKLFDILKINNLIGLISLKIEKVFNSIGDKI